MDMFGSGSVGLGWVWVIDFDPSLIQVLIASVCPEAHFDQFTC